MPVVLNYFYGSGADQFAFFRFLRFWSRMRNLRE